jgi:hypothetical protein
VIGSVDKTLFTLNYCTDFLLVQIYVDDIIFGVSSHSLVSSFQKMMENEFNMSMMEELTFFLDIQVKETKQDTFVYQAKYTKDLMKKFNMPELKPVSTLMRTATSLGLDEDGEAVDQREYKNMIGSLLYLTATRSDIQFTVCLYACFQASPCSSHWMTIYKFLGISNILLSLGFGILLLLRRILLAFSMLILLVVGLTERALLVLVIFLNLLLFAGLLKNNLQLPNPPQSFSM